MLNVKIVASCILLAAPAFADLLVVPNAQTSSTGNATGSAPSSPSDGIYQELYGSGQFTGPIEITGLSFRAAPDSGALDWTIGSLEIFLSTSSKFPHGPTDLMSSTYADNTGPDNTLVFSGTNDVLSAPACGTPGPCAFGPGFTFSTPFDYNPAKGRLLAEFVFTDLNPVSGLIDAEAFPSPGGSISQVNENGSTTATTGTFSFGGNITEFTSTPEPASWTMIAGFTALLWIGRKRFSSRSRN